MSLKTMTVFKLKELKHQVEAAIHAKVTERLHEIESELSKLSRFDGGRGAKAVRAGARGMVAVKYRSSGPSSKAGKKLDEALRSDSPKKANKTRKAANVVEANLSSIATADHIPPLPIAPLPIEPPPVTSIDANGVPADLIISAAA
jgi:hypothetical protein